MFWLHELQQRLAITRRESLALFSILSLFLVGLAIQFVQRQNVPPLDRPNLFADSSFSPDTSAAGESLQIASLARGNTGAMPDEGARQEAEDVGGSPESKAPSDASADGLIDLNAATLTELQDLRGIGPSLAGRIVAYRDKTPFRSVDQLTDVRGIGPKTLAGIRSRLTVSP